MISASYRDMPPDTHTITPLKLKCFHSEIDIKTTKKHQQKNNTKTIHSTKNKKKNDFGEKNDAC